jgi:hypothetical protein
MANTVKMKRSATPGKIPTTAALALGELAVNTNDGKLFLKKSASGVDSIVDVTASGAVASVNGYTGVVSLSKSDIGLGSVENAALSTWTGSANIATLGTIGAGTWSGTAIAVAKGGTGASDAATARANLGLAIGTNVQAWSADLDTIDALAGTSGLLKKTALNTWALDTSTYVPSGGALGTPSSGNLANCTFPTLNQNTTGSAATLTTTRTLTIGSTGKTFNGAANVSWSLAEIGAQAALGFTPVQQGGGTGQGTNKVYIGWSGSQICLQVDSTNFSGLWPLNSSNGWKLWVKFRGTTIDASSGMTSITVYSGTIYNINFSITLSDANYCTQFTINEGATYTTRYAGIIGDQNTTYCRAYTYGFNPTGGIVVFR